MLVALPMSHICILTNTCILNVTLFAKWHRHRYVTLWQLSSCQSLHCDTGDITIWMLIATMRGESELNPYQRSVFQCHTCILSMINHTLYLEQTSLMLIIFRATRSFKFDQAHSSHCCSFFLYRCFSQCHTYHHHHGHQYLWSRHRANPLLAVGDLTPDQRALK